MLSTVGAVGYGLEQHRCGVTAVFLLPLAWGGAEALYVTPEARKKEGLAIALATATIASPHYHEE
jgi:hypothetical protein